MASIAERAVAIVLAQFLPTAPPATIAEVLEGLVPGLKGETDLREVAEVVEDELGDFRARLRAHWNDFPGTTGEYCPFEFSKLDDEVIQGCAWIFEDDTDDVRAQRTALAGQFSPLLEAIHHLDPDEFEKLGAGVLKLIGVSSPTATKPSQDEGIDFFGRLQMSEFLLQNHTLPNVERQLSVWVVGQAKRYVKHPVGTAHIRELIGTCELARAGVWPIQETAYSVAIPIKRFDPIYALMITCGQFSEPAWRILRTGGVIGMDGPMLAQLLALAGVATGDDGKAFDEQKFHAWIAAQKRMT